MNGFAYVMKIHFNEGWSLVMASIKDISMQFDNDNDINDILHDISKDFMRLHGNYP